MSNKNIKTFLGIILGCAFIIYAVLFLIHQNLDSLSISIAIRDFSTTITVTSILVFLFIKFMWKWKFLYKWLVPFPDLTGEWKGHLISDWDKEKKISINIKITQTFTTINIKGKTGESSFQSISSAFNIDFDRSINQLIYTYDNTSKSMNRENNPMHFGSVILNFDKGYNCNSLEGEYWTTRKTKGELYLNKV